MGETMSLAEHIKNNAIIGGAKLAKDSSGNVMGIQGISNIGTKNRLGRRLKIAQIGNSISAYSGVQANQFRPKGALAWANAYLHYGFSNIRSTAGQIGADANSQMDAWGTYAYSGGVLGSQSGDGRTNTIIPNLAAVFAAWTDAPDIIMLNGICENDIAGVIAANVICNNIARLIGECQRAYPAALIVISTPYPSGYYTTVTSDGVTALSTAAANVNAACYATVKAYIRRLASARIVVWTPDAYLNTTTLAPVAGYTGNVATPDLIHPNERGGFVLGRDNLRTALEPYAFPIVVPTNPAEATPANYFAQNAGFNCYANNTAAEVNNGTLHGPQYWTPNNPANATTTFTQGTTAAEGTIVTATNALAPGAITKPSTRDFGLYSTTTGALASVGTALISTQSFMRVAIVNPVGLQSVQLQTSYYTSNQTSVVGQVFQNSNTTWLSGEATDLPFNVGDEFTLYTLPMVAGSNATAVQQTINLLLSAAAPINATPAAQIKALNAVKTPASGVPF
jgi:hypothetical protein